MMKVFRPTPLVMLAVMLAAFAPCKIAAQSSEGWMSDSPAGDTIDIPVTGMSGSAQTLTVSGATSEPPPPPQEFAAPSFGGSSSAPDEITPEIAALTQGVINGPGTASAWQKCFLFVANQIDYEDYYGCKKGALLTYMERKGNDADLATLLVAMLRSAGYPARYGYGAIALPASSDPAGIHMQNWLGCAADATMSNYCARRGFPALYSATDGSGKAYRILHRVWAEVSLSTGWQQLDPALKKRIRIAPSVNVATASGYNRSTLESLGTIATNSVAGIDYSSLSSYLSARTAALLTYLDANNYDTDPVNLVGGWRQEPFYLADGNQYPFPGILQTTANAPYWNVPQIYAALPASLLSTVKLEVSSTASGTPVVATYTAPLANLQGRRLALSFTGDSPPRAQLWLDDTVIAAEAGAGVGTTVKLKITIEHPHNNSLGTLLHRQVSEKSYLRGASYALTYSFNPTTALLKARQEQLDAYRRAGKADNSREVVTETLNVIGLTWLHQTELLTRVLGGKTNCDPLYHHRMGRVSQENGYYIGVLCS